MHCSSSRMHWNCAYPINIMIRQSHNRLPQPSPGHVSYPTDNPKATRLRSWNSLPQLCPGWQDQNGKDPPKKSRTLSSIENIRIWPESILNTIIQGFIDDQHWFGQWFGAFFFGAKPCLKLLMIQQFAENNHASLLAVLVYIMRQKEANISTNEDPGHWLKCTFTCLSQLIIPWEMCL